MFEFGADEAMGRSLDMIFTPEDISDGVLRREQYNASTRGRAEDDRWHLTKSGKRVFCSGLLSRIQSPGFSGYAKIVHDATSRKLAEGRKERGLERERAQSNEVRKLSQLKDEFIAVLSHELKNPLNLIHMKAEILTRLPETRNVARIQEVSDAIQKSVQTQAQIIDDLLDFSRIQTGKLTLRFAPTDIASIARNISSAMQKDFEDGGVDLRTDVPDEPLIIRGDAVRVEQIIWNLLSNALKFTPRGGHVLIQLRPEREHVQLEVTDTGCGIAPDALSTVFEMFQQAPNTPFRAKSAGLGIGLSLVRQLAQLHGGTAEACSEGEGRGACFIVRLPAEASSSQRQTGNLPADVSVFSGVDILLVEDSEDSLQAMEDLLSLYDAKVSTSTNALDALRHAAHRPFDLVVTDVNLPDMEGYELVKRIRQLPDFKTALIVALTGRPVAQEQTRARAAGCDACLSKPFNLEVLADLVHQFQQKGCGT